MDACTAVLQRLRRLGCWVQDASLVPMGSHRMPQLFCKAPTGVAAIGITSAMTNPARLSTPLLDAYAPMATYLQGACHNDDPMWVTSDTLTFHC
jgi:hypothetical protein